MIVQERPENDYESTNDFSVKFVKLDRDGNIEWQKRDEGYSLNQTSDGGYINVKGSRLVKLGGIKHDAPPTGIFQKASETSLNENLNETRTVTPLKKVEGFEAGPAITILLAAFSTKWKRKRERLHPK